MAHYTLRLIAALILAHTAGINVAYAHEENAKGAVIAAASTTATSAKPVTVKLVPFNSEEGIKRLDHASAVADYAVLSMNFEPQLNKFLCGPATASIILNSLRVAVDANGKPLRPQDVNSFDNKYRSTIPKDYDPIFARYTQLNLFNVEDSKIKSLAEVYGFAANGGKADYGMSLESLATMLRAFQTKVDMTMMNDSLDRKALKKRIIENLKTPGDFVIVNFARPSLGQKGGGHISPLAAYHKATDSVLLMDVNPNMAEWEWVKLDDLLNAANTSDSADATKRRGLLFVSEGRL